MSVALRMAVGVLALAAVLVLPVVLAARGYFDPQQDRAAYEERVAMARAYLAPAEDRLFTANPKIRRAMNESIAKLEQQYPEVLRARRDEVDAIYDAWLGAVAEFSTAASAHWFATHFTTDDIRAHFDRPLFWNPMRFRRIVVFLLHRGELDTIIKHTEMVMLCRLVQDVIPALADLGAEPASARDEVDGLDGLRATCEEAAGHGFMDPAMQIH